MPRKDYVINDVVKGEVVFKAGSVGDFALLRSNGMPTYNYACVIDDGLMKITQCAKRGRPPFQHCKTSCAV